MYLCVCVCMYVVVRVIYTLKKRIGMKHFDFKASFPLIRLHGRALICGLAPLALYLFPFPGGRIHPCTHIQIEKKSFLMTYF